MKRIYFSSKDKRINLDFVSNNVVIKEVIEITEKIIINVQISHNFDIVFVVLRENNDDIDVVDKEIRIFDIVGEQDRTSNLILKDNIVCIFI